MCGGQNETNPDEQHVGREGRGGGRRGQAGPCGGRDWKAGYMRREGGVATGLPLPGWRRLPEGQVCGGHGVREHSQETLETEGCVSPCHAGAPPSSHRPTKPGPLRSLLWARRAPPGSVGGERKDLPVGMGDVAFYHFYRN